MAKIFLWIAIAVSLLTAGLGFVTKGKIDEKNALLKSENTRANGLAADKKKLTLELKETTENLVAAKKDIEEKTATIAKNEMDIAAAKEENTKLTGMLQESNMKLAAAQVELDKVNEELAKIPKNGNNPVDIKAITDENASLKTQLAESHQVQDTLRKGKNEAEESVGKLTTLLKKYQAPIARRGLTARVTAVNAGWNFVVIDIGDKGGSVNGAPLIASRNGQTIAQLKVTSVEPNTSIADVVPGTMRRGNMIQPGDLVIFAGRQDDVPQGEGADSGAALPSGAQARTP